MRKKLLSVSVEGIVVNSSSVDVPAGVLGRLDELEKAAARYLGRFGIKGVEMVRLSEGAATLYGPENAAISKLHPLHDTNLQATAEALKLTFEDGISRYSRACSKNVPAQQKSVDPSLLALNSANWNLVGASTTIALLPDEVSNCALIAHDPATLRLVQTDVPIEHLITRALVKGVRVIGDFTNDMFPDLDTARDVLITLDGEIAEIETRASVRELQNLFTGYSLVSARVKGKKGSVPVVSGELAIERC